MRGANKDASDLCSKDGVTGGTRPAKFEGPVVVPHNDGVAESGVVCSIAAQRDDHEAVCWHRRITGKTCSNSKVLQRPLRV